jgi:hypothetical protein
MLYQNTGYDRLSLQLTHYWKDTYILANFTNNWFKTFVFGMQVCNIKAHVNVRSMLIYWQSANRNLDLIDHN